MATWAGRAGADLDAEAAHRRVTAPASRLQDRVAAPGAGALPPSLLAHPAIGGRGNGGVRAAALQRMQQAGGNRAMQRWLAGPSGRPGFAAGGRATGRGHLTLQRQDDDAQQPVAVAPVPNVHGRGEPETVVANAVGALNLQGKTTAKFDGGHFRTEDLTTEAGSDCKGCKAKDCVHVTGTRVSDYHVTTKVKLPAVPRQRGMTACERQAIRNAIDTTLANHEQEHVQAFEEYNGTTSTPFDETMCRRAVAGFVRAQHRAEAKERIADAKAASAALDPFNFDVDFSECEAPAEDSHS